MISYDTELRNKTKYLNLIKYLIRFKYYKKTCKHILNNINESMTKKDDVDVDKLKLLNNEFKLNILLMVSYYNKMKTLYSSIN